MSEQLITVPDDLLETGGEATDWYPLGDFAFTVEEVYETELGMNEQGEPYQGFMTSDGLQVSVQCGDFMPLDGQEDPPGNNKVFIKFVLVDGHLSYDTIDVADKETTAAKLRTSTRRLASFFPAMGANFSVEAVGALRSNEFTGKRLRATFQKWQTKKGNVITGEGSFPRRFNALY